MYHRINCIRRWAHDNTTICKCFILRWPFVRGFTCQSLSLPHPPTPQTKGQLVMVFLCWYPGKACEKKTLTLLWRGCHVKRSDNTHFNWYTLRLVTVCVLQGNRDKLEMSKRWTGEEWKTNLVVFINVTSNKNCGQSIVYNENETVNKVTLRPSIVPNNFLFAIHCPDVIMGAMTSQTASFLIV